LLDVAILGQVALGYSPFIDRNRTVAATRLTVVPLRPDAILDVAQLLHAVGDVWPASGGTVSLNVMSESLLHDLLQASPTANLMVEVPNFMASDPDNVEALLRLHGNGNTLLLKGRPNDELPREVLPCFRYSIIDLADERRIGPAAAAPPGVTRSIQHVQSGVRTIADMEASFARGAHAVLGWPIDDAISATQHRCKGMAQPDMQVVVELIHRVERQRGHREARERSRDPFVASRCSLHHSPAFGPRRDQPRSATPSCCSATSGEALAACWRPPAGRQPAADHAAPRCAAADGRAVAGAATRKMGRLFTAACSRRSTGCQGSRQNSGRPSRPSARFRRWSRTPARTSRTWRWSRRQRASRCTTIARLPSSS
jgi:hypothetical protein